MATATAGAEEIPANGGNLKEQSSLEDEATAPNNISQDTPSKVPPSTMGEMGSLSVPVEQNGADPPNVHYPQPQTIYFGCYGNASEWEDYSHYVTPDLLDIGSPGIYNESQTMMYPTGYGYNVQMPFGPFSPVSPSPPSARGDGQVYSTQQFSYTGPYFHQSIPPNMPYLNSPTHLSQTDLAMPVPVDHQSAFHSDASNSNGLVFGQRPNHPSYGLFDRNSYSGSSGNPSFYDTRQAFDGFGFGGVWSDWTKSADGQRSPTPLSPAPLAGAYGHGVTPFASGQVYHQQRPLHCYGPVAGSYARRNPGGMYSQGGSYESSFRTNGRGFIRVDKDRGQAKETASLCNCNGIVDFLGEQNRGPRSTRQNNCGVEENSLIDCKPLNPSSAVDKKLYNKPDFVIEYNDARFFIIKSYSEDNIHRSIKYGVWTSTPNGNRKLDAAFHEAEEKDDACPVFLFFSVNASAQFCGVAEMAGPVDFEKSVGYWQQNKWCGHFAVKWHIVKDVPNSVLRHIILENNDNKPVTNSRDTQEVKLEQGLEMLSIFKKYEADMSILDDFDFYETREKAMQERKAWRQQNQSHSAAPLPAICAADHHHPASLNVNFVNHMSKTFAQAVRMDDSRKEDAPTIDSGCTGATELTNQPNAVVA